MVSVSSVDDYLGECLVELEVHFDHLIFTEMVRNPPTCFAVKSEDMTPWS